MVPSMSPSKYRSSLPERSPRMTTDLPMTVEPSAGFIRFCSPKDLVGCGWVLPELYPSACREATLPNFGSIQASYVRWQKSLRRQCEEWGLASVGLRVCEVVSRRLLRQPRFAERQPLWRRHGVRLLRCSALLAALASASSGATAQASATTKEAEAILGVPARS